MNLAIVVSLRDANLKHALTTLESLDRTLPRRPVEVIVVDRLTAGCAPPIPRPEWRLVRADGDACVPATAAPGLCLVDVGTVFLPGWLPPMRRLLQSAPRAGCIGNIQREPYSGLIEHAGVGFDADGLPVAIGRNLALLPRDASDRRAAVSMACCLMRRTVFEQVGGFDPKFQGSLGETDFCLRAAEAGYRHYVANRSVVYRYDDAPPIADDPDLPLYRARWGNRARACHERRDRLRREPSGVPFSPERWEMAREARRTLRLEVEERRAIGRRYLAKHWHRPWRYNAGRVSRALGQALQPLPAPVPHLPAVPADVARPDDGWLFDPPPQP